MKSMVLHLNCFISFFSLSSFIINSILSHTLSNCKVQTLWDFKHVCYYQIMIHYAYIVFFWVVLRCRRNSGDWRRKAHSGRESVDGIMGEKVKKLKEEKCYKHHTFSSFIMMVVILCLSCVITYKPPVMLFSAMLNYFSWQRWCPMKLNEVLIITINDWDN